MGKIGFGRVKMQKMRRKTTQKTGKETEDKMEKNSMQEEGWEEGWEERLLQRWCDALLSCQIREMPQKIFRGGILCPACGRIHGRCADAIYPMLYLRKQTGDEKYLESAKLLFSWSENMVQPDGRYLNDFDSDWAGITVFAGIGLAESLLDFSELLDEMTVEAWKKRLYRAVWYLMEHIMEFSGNINYPVTASYLFELAGMVFGENLFYKKARELAHWSLDYFTVDGLFYGEGLSRCPLSEKGCRPVDLGYNVEESLSALLHYAVLAEDEEVYEKTIQSMKTHLLFMLPDGAWNNSWGTRNNKWAYWGSRTSDGCAPGWALAGLREPVLREAVMRNMRLLCECTGDDTEKGGLLYGGWMNQEAKVAPCVHHTFCHAKALAEWLFLRGKQETDTLLSDSLSSEFLLPIERMNGVRFFPSIRVWLVRKHGFLGTVSDYDIVYSKEGHAHGGSLTMLWADGAGPIFAGTMTKYEMIEHGNMQLAPDMGDIALTPRLQYEEDGCYFRSCNDLQAVVQERAAADESDAVCIAAKGTLRDREQRGQELYQMQYRWEQEGFLMEAECETRDVLWCLPVIASWKDQFLQRAGNVWELQKENGERFLLSGNRDFLIPQDRIFNLVGGFLAAKIVIPLKRGERGKMRVQREIRGEIRECREK